MTGHLFITLATGRHLALKMQSDAPFVPGLAAAGNVNGRRGDELFVDLHHLTTAEIIGVFTFAKGHLRLAGKVFAYGNDFPIHWGVDCATHGTKRVMVDHEFQLQIVGTHWRWTRKDVFFVWRGSVLHRTGAARPQAHHRPPTQKAGRRPLRQGADAVGVRPRFWGVGFRGGFGVWGGFGCGGGIASQLPRN